MKKLLARFAAGDDVRSQLSPELAAALTPDETRDVQSELKNVWPSDSLVLVIRKSLSSGIGSVYRIRKGDHALLITYALDKEGKVTLFANAPDQEYQ